MNLRGKILVPAILVTLAAVQSFGIDAGRALRYFPARDTSVIADVADTTDFSDTVVFFDPVADSLLQAALADLNPDKIKMTADSISFLEERDTLIAPDSLKDTDPVRFRYFVELRDSLTRAETRNFLLAVEDSLGLTQLDSLYIKDSTDIAKAKFDAWFSTLSKKEKKIYIYEHEILPRKMARVDSILNRRDSIRAYKDSVLEATPRILQTFAIPDSLQYKRLITWHHDRDFNEIKIDRFDTTYNYHFNDSPVFKKDINATYLGITGSAAQLYDYFKREDERNVSFYTPYRIYAYTPENLPFYNTKTTYTELAYWGTLFANRDKEESNIKVLTTQNILPQLNITLEYHRFGGNGMLSNEKTDNRTAVISTNYMGKRYLMHAAYVYNKVKRNENGGVVNTSDIRDTTLDAREISVHLTNAKNQIKRNTLFLDQTFRIPLNFMKKKEKRASKDSVDRDVTTAFIGHTSEFSVFTKQYTDNISTSDSKGRDFYHNNFFLDPTRSADSMRVMRFDNKIFMRLQPWKADGIVSKLDVGVGDKLMSYYRFLPSSYIVKTPNEMENSIYVYAGVQGQYKKYFDWNARGRYTFAGYEVNDFGIEANLVFKAYPFRRERNSPLAISAHFETNLQQPDYYQQHVYTNHYRWDNSFGKVSTTKIRAELAIPRWKLDASFGYGLLSGNIYYDHEGIIRQNTTPMSVMTASLRKEFKLWLFRLDNRILFQLSSNEKALPLPLVSINLRYFLQFNVVKNVMQMQIGADARFTTKWYAPGYNPVLGVFFNQREEKYGNCPDIDAFVNVQWKRACIFLKVVNVGMGWPNKRADYFSAHNQIISQRAFKVGIFWPFYVLPGKKTKAARSVN